ncbi:MAG: sigma-70 family RNA polymerase sigma factor [Actinomycetota bacterium]|nr:sigma-70 family RNA polymerase sigma factor [Actinomycetota bacterium]
MEDEVFSDLLHRAQIGEPAGYDGLVGLVDRRLVGFARARGADDPEGLANEVLVVVCRSVGTFAGNAAQFRAWVFTIARNRLVDERRRFGRRVHALPVDPSTMPEAGYADDGFAAVGAHERLSELLAPLTDEQREVLVLRIVAELSVEETAAATGRQPGAVRALQHRALRQLRSQLSVQE